MKIKHAVLMVSYNQEKYIREAIESIMNNDVLPEVFIIHDDRSSDETWNIISEYAQKYPNIIKATQNEKNLGVYGNINSVYKEGINTDCDILSWCSGDDLWEKGLLAKFNKFIIDNNIDYKNEKFIIVTNAIHLYPDGEKRIIDNYSLRDKEPRLCRLGKKLDYRDVGISRAVFDNYVPIREDIGLASDTIFTIYKENNCKKWYFLNENGAYYRVNVGVVSAEKIQKLLESEAKAYQILLESNDYYKFTTNEKNIIHLWISFDTLICQPTLKNWFYYLESFISNIRYNSFLITKRMILCLLPPFMIRIMTKIRYLQKKRNLNKQLRNTSDL